MTRLYAKVTCCDKTVFMSAFSFFGRKLVVTFGFYILNSLISLRFFAQRLHRREEDYVADGGGVG